MKWDLIMRGRDRLSWWILGLSAFGAVADAVIVGSTYLPGAPHVAEGDVFTLFALMFPLLGISLWRSAIRRKNVRLADLGIPLAALVGLVCVFAAAFAIASPSINDSVGQPVIEHGRYGFNNHGQFIPTTAAGYRHGISLDERTFGAPPVVVYYVAAILSLGVIRRARAAPKGGPSGSPERANA